jgi:2,3-bisphosphoglycerate-dependent phosphoglycerate mutase
MQIVFVRHGESIWNLENKFTGWTDVGLSTKGIQEATIAGKNLKKKDFIFDISYTSFLKRAKNTLSIILKELSLSTIPCVETYKLNERHYGALQGLNKEDTSKKYGHEQVQRWRRSISEIPPLLNEDDERSPRKDILYKDIPKEDLPLGENLQMTIDRVIPFYKEIICPEINSGKKIILVAHGNSIRALLKFLDNISDEDIMSLEIPTGKPLVYELESCFKVTHKYYL